MKEDWFDREMYDIDLELEKGLVTNKQYLKRIKELKDEWKDELQPMLDAFK